MIRTIHASFVHLIIWFHWKTVLYQRNELKFFSATGYPRRTDSNTMKTFFLGHLFYTHMYVQSWVYFCWSMWTTSLCLSRQVEGPPHFLEDFLSSSWLPFQKKKKKATFKTWAWEVKFFTLLITKNHGLKSHLTDGISAFIVLFNGWTWLD